MPFNRILRIVSTWSHNIFSLIYVLYQWESTIRFTGTPIYLQNQWSGMLNSYWLLIGYVATNPLLEKNNWQQVFPLVDFALVVVNMVSEKNWLWIIMYWIILSVVVKCLDKTLSYLLFVSCVFLLTSPSSRVSDIIHNLDRYVGFIPIGMLASAEETAEYIYWMWPRPRMPSILYSRLVIVVTDGDWNMSHSSLGTLQLPIEALIL